MADAPHSGFIITLIRTGNQYINTDRAVNPTTPYKVRVNRQVALDKEQSKRQAKVVWGV